MQHISRLSLCNRSTSIKLISSVSSIAASISTMLEWVLRSCLQTPGKEERLCQGKYWKKHKEVYIFYRGFREVCIIYGNACVIYRNAHYFEDVSIRRRYTIKEKTSNLCPIVKDMKN